MDLPDSFSAPFVLQAEPCGEAGTVVSGGEYVETGTLVEQDATCGCACQLPTDLGCPDLQVVRHSTANCSSQGTAGSLAEDACIGLPGSTFSLFVGALSFGNPTGTCASNGVPSTRPPLVYQVPLHGCAAPTGDCEGGACLPPGHCVFSEVAQDCPQGMSERFLVRDQDVIDDRVCSCKCGGISGQCMFGLQIHGGGVCGGQLTLNSDTGCISDEQGSAISSARYMPTTNGSCVTQHEHDGDAVVESTVLVCCAQ